MRPLSSTPENDLQSQDRSAPTDAESQAVRGYECDRCGQTFDGEPAGAGLFLWSRGDELRYEEPPLCEPCANQVTLGAILSHFEDDEE